MLWPLADRTVSFADAAVSAGNILGAALPAALVLGLPAHLILMRLGRHGPRAYAFAGALLGAATGYAFVAPFGATLIAQLAASFTGAVSGGYVAAVFWWIAVRRRRPDSYEER
jgi:flagellar motor component MotA